MENNIIEKLSVFKIQNSNSNLMSQGNYTWRNTVDRTEDENLSSQLTRFSNQIDILLETLSQLVNENKLNEDFTILELFCGNGVMLHTVKSKYPKCIPIGLDLLNFNMWDVINKEYPDIKFIQSDFFEIYNSDIELNIDVMITYNTWRGWDNSVGPNSKVSKDDFMNWAKKNFKYIIADNTILPYE
jgi:hypothetical protein